MFFKLFLAISILTVVHCISSTQDPFAELLAYSKYFQVDQLIQNQSILSKNITFNSTREKYYFIYLPLFEICLQRIGQDFQPLLDSVTPSGIGAAGYGILAGMKIALKVGLWKTGIFGLLKASTATIFSVSALPVAIGVGTLTFLYNKHEKDQIKQKCSLLINHFENIVKNQEFQFLTEIKATVYHDMKVHEKKLRHINKKQKSIKSILKKYQEELSYLKPKIQMHRQYFSSLRKIMNN